MAPENTPAISSMYFIDTHTHLYDEQLQPDSEAAIQKAIDAGVAVMLMPNCDSSTIDGMMKVADRWKGVCLPMMGLHPCYVKDNYEAELATVAAQLQTRRFCAVGEIGLDYYWDKTFVPQQKDALAYQIELALEYDLPIVIHSRESTADCIDIVRSKQTGQLRGIFHCFSGTLEEAAAIADMGLHLGIGGVVTYKKSTLPDIVKAMPLETMVLETDAPYLAPVPYRGKRNESAYIPLIAQAIADIREMPLEQVAAITTQNAQKIFGL